MLRSSLATVGRYRTATAHLVNFVRESARVRLVGRLPVEDAKPIVILSVEQEGRFLNVCSDWEFPIFLTLMLTGLRPGELCHLLVEDLDLQANLLHVRSKPTLGWQVKTRSQRPIPIAKVLADVLGRQATDRSGGVLFRQPRCTQGYRASLEELRLADLEAHTAQRLAAWQQANGRPPVRAERLGIVRRVWRDLAAVKEDQVRTHFIRIAKASGVRGATAPKLLRHGFATALQVANTDPLVRSLLMGHAPASGAPGGGLGMTAVYTHTSMDTLREQLERAMLQRASILTVANNCLARHRSDC